MCTACIWKGSPPHFNVPMEGRTNGPPFHWFVMVANNGHLSVVLVEHTLTLLGNLAVLEQRSCLLPVDRCSTLILHFSFECWERRLKRLMPPTRQPTEQSAGDVGGSTVNHVGLEHWAMHASSVP